MREEEFQRHPVWKAVAQVEAALEAFSEQSKQDMRFVEFKRKVEYLKWILNQSDPTLFSASDLVQMSNELSSVAQHMPSDAANWQHVSQIDNYFSSIFFRNPYPRVQKIFKSDAANFINEIRDSASETLIELRKEAAEIEASLTVLTDQLSSNRAQVLQDSELVVKLDNQLSAKLEVWEGQFSAAVVERIAEFNLKFSEFVSERTEGLRGEVEALRKQTESSKKAMTNQIQAVAEQRKKEDQFFFQTLDQHRKLAEEILTKIQGIYETAGQTALSGGFVEASIAENRLYEDNAWYAKFFFIVGAISLAALWGFHIFFETGSLNDVLLRLPISFVFFVPAIYFSALAGKHRKTSVDLQSLGLRIKAFDAYLFNAKDDERQKLRAEMANVFFDDVSSKTTKAVISETVLSKLTEKISILIEKVVDKVPLGGKE